METRLSQLLLKADEFKLTAKALDFHPRNHKYLPEGFFTASGDAKAAPYINYVRDKIWDYVAGDCFGEFKDQNYDPPWYSPIERRFTRYNPDTQNAYLANLLFDITRDFSLIFQDQKPETIQLLAKLFLIKQLMIVLSETQAKLEENNLDSRSRETYEYCVRTFKHYLFNKNYFLFYDNEPADESKDLEDGPSEKSKTKNRVQRYTSLFELGDAFIPFQPSILQDDVFKELIKGIEDSTVLLSNQPAADKLQECFLSMVATHANVDQHNYFYLDSFPDRPEFYSSENTRTDWGWLFFRIAEKESREKKLIEAKDDMLLIENFYSQLVQTKGVNHAQAAVNNAISNLRQRQNNQHSYRHNNKKVLNYAVEALLLLRSSLEPSEAEKRETERFLDEQINECKTAAQVLAIYNKYVDNFTVSTRRFTLWGDYYANSKIHFITKCQNQFNSLLEESTDSDLNASALFGHSEQNMRAPVILKGARPALRQS